MLVEREPDGRIPSLASLLLGTFGKIKGPFDYDGVRKDDPNDRCPHKKLRALIDASHFTEREAADYPFDRLNERRDRIGRHWLRKVNPLDWFLVTTNANEMKIDFEDLWMFYSLDPEATATYHYKLRYKDKKLMESALSGTKIVLTNKDVESMATAFQPGEGDYHCLYQVDIRTNRDNKGWSKPVRVWLWYYDDAGEFEYVGLEHVD